jgi:hypothetical protein
MSLLAIWLLWCVINGLMLIGIAAWDLRHPDKRSFLGAGAITAGDVLLGLGAACMPVIQIATILVCIFYILTEICPNVVLFTDAEAGDVAKNTRVNPAGKTPTEVQNPTQDPRDRSQT